jgi:hypothetical protein
MPVRPQSRLFTHADPTGGGGALGTAGERKTRLTRPSAQRKTPGTACIHSSIRSTVAHREVVEGVTDIRVAHEDDPAVIAVTRVWTGQAPAWHHDGAQNDLDPDHSQRGCIMAVAGREEEHWPDVDCDCAVSFYFPRLAR